MDAGLLDKNKCHHNSKLLPSSPLIFDMFSGEHTSRDISFSVLNFSGHLSPTIADKKSFVVDTLFTEKHGY